MLDLPSFGEPNEDCGKYIPAAMYFCPACATTHERRHVCNRYDCPQHWAHAIRRRTAGSTSGAGVAPQLDALRRYLNAYRDDNQYFHHLVYNPPRPRRLDSRDVLERELETVREIMDAFGIQGLVAYHPWAGENEEHDRDDRGEWKTRLGRETEWDAVREELQFRPHFHIVGVAPKVDVVDTTTEIEAETGAVIKRITKPDSNVSIEDDEAMCRVVSYCLSHAGIYDSEGGQRRLAAWMKGPDVDHVSPLDKHKSRIRAMVFDAARDTLGIAPPDLTCDEDLPPNQIHLGYDDLPDIHRPSNQREGPLAELYARGEDPGSQLGAQVDTDTITVHTRTGPSAGQTAGTGFGSSSSQSAAQRDPFETWNPGSSKASSTSTSSSSGDGSGDVVARDQDDVDDEPETCGTRLRHISKAGEYLLDSEWNQEHADEDIADVEAAYQSYVNWMTGRGLDPAEDPFTLPEETPIDRPPDD